MFVFSKFLFISVNDINTHNIAEENVIHYFVKYIHPPTPPPPPTDKTFFGHIPLAKNMSNAKLAYTLDLKHLLRCPFSFNV